MPEADRGRWRDLVERRLPEAARADWPVRRDHCFARILLDNTCGGPWRECVRAPAWANLPPDRLADAIALGEAVLAGQADLDGLNRRSLALRGKLRGRAAFGFPGPPWEGLRDQDLRLRTWRPEDADALATLNTDADVMRYFPAVRDPEASRAEAHAWRRRFEVDGFGPWVVEEDGAFVGLVGGARLMRAMPFPHARRPGDVVEVVWRLARPAWGRGIATRAARLALRDLFGRCGLAGVVAFTAEANEPSRRVMERLGMHPAGRFAHPALAPGHPLQAHLLYRLPMATFESEGSEA